ncbi:MAG: 2-hydroxy-6-oxohepta-2,4-dienoate hydrolase (TodF) [Archaeoglobus fulgidus]|uniref:2-hydroxy-6-oxohepta-2,4-dienoate hydrolase (TodF) n=1 Tax=Archaeoglobus fulgidus TaxID=2234 RepID=A0A101E2P1_ARCFL|nr:alpha/beta hydrolase [Archaeoglobus fulgidus]KUJ94262.1 MAG: 2-hydroxy-6-oxohepta-2,4-dienoate hydrolase (TodF) [Archaeoglobus fulgidus]KUK07537.1 MAG: 2-hydroxy-6-oxohepta-2,4-dienoate hydrolase (TodF) [Archaeoglobus fulgidus]
MHFDKKIGRVFARIYVERALIVCHGLPYEPGSVVEKSYIDLAGFFSKRGFPTLIFDFSGTGLSDGHFSLKAWVEDLLRIAENFEEVSILGYSMGGAVAVRAAAELRNLRKMVVVSSPCCLDMFTEQVLKLVYENARMKNTLKGIGSFESFKNLFLKEFTEIEPKNWIGDVGAEKLIVHGRLDEIVPFENGLTLYNLAREPKAFVEVEKGDHFLRQDNRVVELIAEWLDGKIKEKIIRI